MRLGTLWSATLLCAWLAGASAQPVAIQALPKYGGVAKSDAQRAADEAFLAKLDGLYHGDRAQAARDVAQAGWKLMVQGKPKEAMARFNQAWLLNPAEGTAIWGMADAQAAGDRAADALPLFAEAAPLVGAADINFRVDYAKAEGLAAAQTRDAALFDKAFADFGQVFARDPQHTANLQNWAITLFYAERYAEAWKKIELAEATPGRAAIDPNLVAALEAKMPRPK